MAKRKKKKQKSKPAVAAASSAETVESAKAPAAEVRNESAAMSQFEWKQLLREPVAIGLGLMMLYRPWKDGMTYQHFNVYFTLWITFIAAGYVGWKLRKREMLRFPVPTALFGGFLLVAYLTALVGVDYNIALRSFLPFASYFLLFFLITDGVRTRLGIGLLVGALAITSLVNAVWAVVHTEFVLPHVRNSISQSPALLQMYFGTDVLTPELKNRLEMQRAFGTFLHPNALAGFLVLCTPLMFFWGIASIPGMRRAADESKSTSGFLNSNFATLLVAGLSGLAMLVYMYGLNALLEGYTEGSIRLIKGSGRSIFFYGGLPIAFGLVSGYLTHLKGTLGYGRILSTLILFLAAIVQLYSLMLTFSRGAVLGFMFAGLVAAVFMVIASRRIPPLTRFSTGWAELAAAAVIVISSLFLPTAQGLEIADDGFQLPDPNLEFRPQNLSYSVSDLEVTGRDVGVQEITSGRSLEFRLTYWRVGMLIAKDNLLTGVGLGNFGTVYGMYQYLDAHDVKAAHNDYLQMLTDTGLIGFLLFMAFWIYVLIWGGGQIVRDRPWLDRLMLLGLYTGVLAYLAHTFFDFNFQNPTLATTAYLMTALLFTLAIVDQRDEVASPPSRSAVLAALSGKGMQIAVLLLIVFVLFAGIRQFRYDHGRTMGSTWERLYNIGNTFHVARPLRALESLLSKEVLSFDSTKQPVHHRVYELRALIDDDDDLLELGVVQVPVEGSSGGWRRLTPGEPIPESAIVTILNPEKARELAFRYGIPMLAEFDRLDEIYPHGTEVPAYAYRWTKALTVASTDKASQLKYGDMCLLWSKRRADRSPFDPEAQIEYCGGLWERGKVDQGIEQLDYYRRGVEQYKSALRLYPTSQSMYQQYGESMQQIGDAFIAAGKIGQKQGNPLGDQLIKEGNEFMQDAQAGFERARWLARYKHDVLRLR